MDAVFKKPRPFSLQKKRLYSENCLNKESVKGNPQRGFSLKTVHRTVFYPFLRFMRQSLCLRKLQTFERFDRNFCAFTVCFPFYVSADFMLPMTARRVLSLIFPAVICVKRRCQFIGSRPDAENKQHQYSGRNGKHCYYRYAERGNQTP